MRYLRGRKRKRTRKAWCCNCFVCNECVWESWRGILGVCVRMNGVRHLLSPGTCCDENCTVTLCGPGVYELKMETRPVINLVQHDLCMSLSFSQMYSVSMVFYNENNGLKPILIICINTCNINYVSHLRNVCTWRYVKHQRQYQCRNMWVKQHNHGPLWNQFYSLDILISCISWVCHSMNLRPKQNI